MKPDLTMAKTDSKSVNEYIASKPRDVRGILKRVRSFELDQIRDEAEAKRKVTPTVRNVSV